DTRAPRGGTHSDDPLETRAQAVAPVRELGSALLAAQNRHRWAPRPGAEPHRRDAADAACEPGLREDRLREVGPRAVARGGEITHAERSAARDEGAGGGCEVPGVRRAPTLVVDDGDLVPVRAEAEHRADEVVPRLP